MPHCRMGQPAHIFSLAPAGESHPRHTMSSGAKAKSGVEYSCANRAMAALSPACVAIQTGHSEQTSPQKAIFRAGAFEGSVIGASSCSAFAFGFAASHSRRRASRVYRVFSTSSSSFLLSRGGRPILRRKRRRKSAQSGRPESPHSYKSLYRIGSACAGAPPCCGTPARAVRRPAKITSLGTPSTPSRPSLPGSALRGSLPGRAGT